MFSSTTPDFFTRPDAVAAGNESLQCTILELRHVCNALLRGDARAPAEARRLLSEFTAELCVYFDAEEGDDYFGTMATDNPALKTRMDDLGAAHSVLRESTGALQQLAGDESRSHELAFGIGRVIADFEAHEHEENTLLQDFYCVDEGGGGQ